MSTENERKQAIATKLDNQMRQAGHVVNRHFKGRVVKIKCGKYKGRGATADHASFYGGRLAFFVQIPFVNGKAGFLNDHVDSRRGYHAYELEFLS